MSPPSLPACSLQSAAIALQRWAVSQRAANPQPSTAQRIELFVRPPHRSALAWLQTQPHPQKLFFRGRGANAREVAAVGFAHLSAAPSFTQEAHLALAALLNPAYPTQRFYGATRFSADTAISPEWAPYQGYTFVLPAIELSLDCDGVFRLAANYLPEGHDALQDALAALVVAPTLSCLFPRATKSLNLTTFLSWDTSMTAILSALRAACYDKIVLARRKRFIFHKHAATSPIAILSALDAQNTRSPATAARCSYLFCLQIDDTHAFLGCTPERLFHLQGRNILTEALAGTVRRGTNGDEGDVMAELLGVKNLEEHRFVVDYIRSALNSCGVLAQTSGPHVRRLPHLMHLATDIRGQFPPALCTNQVSEDSPPHSSVYRLLRTMHPTPAVCGMPRESTIAELPALEDFDRGFFAGPLGWFSRDAGEFCVAIRSALVDGCDVTAFAGSGIVQASESKSEWDETELKMSAFTELFLGTEGKDKGLQTTQCHPEIVAADNSREPVLSVGSDGEETEKRLNGVHKDFGPDEIRSMSMPLFQGPSEPTLHMNRLGLQRTGSHPRVQTERASFNSISLPMTAARPCMPEHAVHNSFDPTKLKSIPNLNTVWGCCCIEELCRNGVTLFIVAPGSRSAPLAVGVARSKHATLLIAHDERGAGFLGVGYARATGLAAAVITSSGTAVANLLPSVVEASADSLPIVILTADRPPELRDVGANQAIHQPGIFGTYTLWSKDVPCPCEDIPLQNLLSDVDYAVHMSGSGNIAGQSGASPSGAGPVHLNMMFREKLAPDEEIWDRKYVANLSRSWQRSLSPFTRYHMGTARKLLKGKQRVLLSSLPASSVSGDIILDLLPCFKTRKAGVIVVGGGCGSIRTEDEGLALYEVAELLGWPVIADVCSGLRFDKTDKCNIVHYCDQILTSQVVAEMLVPDAVLQFGERITSKRVLGMISRASSASIGEEDFMHVMVSHSTRRCDPSFTVTHRLHSTISQFLASLAPFSMRNGNCCSDMSLDGQISLFKPSQMMVLAKLSRKVEQVVQEMMGNVEFSEIFEPWCVRVISETVARPSGLFIGNSMPIRDFDAFSGAMHNGIKIKVAANRGASGIDGIVSTGIGFGIGLDLDVTIVLGDMSMIHDMNALHLLRREESSIPIKVTIVVVNNGGGGIFSMLPIAKHRDVFSPAFDTPHSVQFKKGCEMFGVEYMAVERVAELRKAIESKGRGGHRLIEVLVSNNHGRNAELHRTLGAVISHQVDALLERSGSLNVC